MNSKNFLSKLFWNYIYAGKDWDPVQSRQVSFINSFSFIGVLSAIGFGVYRAAIGETGGLVEVVIGLIGALNVWHLRRSFNTDRASWIVLLLMVGMIAFLFVDGGIAGTGLYWAFTFPVLAFFLFDDTVGLLWNLALLMVLAVISLAKVVGLVSIHYEWIVLRQAFFSFSAVVGLLYFYMKFTGINARIFAERTQKLETSFKEKREQTEAWAHGVQRALKDKLDNFFQTAGDLMCLANNEGYFIEINPAFIKILGYTPEELLRTPFIEFVHPDDKEKTDQAMKKLIKGELVGDFTNRYRKKDGKYTWLTWNATPHDGVIYAVAHSVDDFMGAQEKLQAKVTELEKLNRLMVNRELVMIEMKKELAAIKGNTHSNS